MIYLKRLQSICKTYKSIIMTYEKDEFGASSFSLANFLVFNNKFTELEKSDFKEAAIAVKNKIIELSSIHTYF